MARVSDQEPATLRYLAEFGLVPGARVVVLEKASFAGPLSLRVRETDQLIGYDRAHVLVMAPAPDELAPRSPTPARSVVR